jgi:uracil-DNA glycosylase family 4
VNLKPVLGEIETDCDSLHGGRLLSVVAFTDNHVVAHRCRRAGAVHPIKICRHWLFEEIEAIGRRLIVALGATAAQGLTGRAIRMQSNRGSVLTEDKGLRVLMTIHPSALLRLQDEEEKRSGYASLIERLFDYSPDATNSDIRAAE